MTPARVDVGIATYRPDPAFLREAVASVLAQTLVEWRLVVWEDGPATSAVAQALEPFLADPRVELRAGGENRGAPAAKNALAALGDAPYLLLLDDDDTLEPGVLAARVAPLDADPACGLAGGGCVFVDAAGAELRRTRRVARSGTLEPITWRRTPGDAVATAGTLYRRSAFEAAGGFDTRFPTTYDAELLTRLAAAHPVAWLDVHDVTYRQHERMDSQGPGRAAEWSALQEHLDAWMATEHPELAGISPRSEAERRLDRARWHLAAGLDAAEEGTRREALMRLRRALGRDRRIALDPGAPALLLAVATGRVGRRGLRAVRQRGGPRGAGR